MRSAEIRQTDRIGIESAGHLVGHEHVAAAVLVMNEEQTFRRQRLRALQSGHLLNAVIVIFCIQVNNLKDGNNRSQLIVVTVVEATLKHHSDVVALVLLLAEGEVLDCFRFGAFVVTTAIGVVTKFSSDFFREVAGVANDIAFAVVDREAAATETDESR